MKLFDAWKYVHSVDLIDIDELRALGIKCVIIDRDNTCVPRDSKDAPQEVLDWIDRVHEAGISTYLVSNNIHVERVARSAGELKSKFVSGAMKPAPFAFRRVLRETGVSRYQAVVIGDQIYTDVLAGRLAGIRTILVRPQCETDLWYTKIMRRWEARVLAGRIYEGE